MARYEITYSFSNAGTRNQVRMRVVNKLALEEPGAGNGKDATRYIYYVETLSNGDRVYLQRPANLHNGFDFLVCVENTNYAMEGKRKRNYPKHEDIAKDLVLKKEENLQEYKKLYLLIKKVFECQEVSEQEIMQLHFSTGFSAEHIVKTLKWLFIEQDIRYWNYSGRNMTWSIIPSPEGEQ